MEVVTAIVALGNSAGVRIAEAWAAVGWIATRSMPSPELCAAFELPPDDSGAGAALALPEQALIADQVGDAGVLRRPAPLSARRASFSTGFPAAGLVDAKYRARSRLAQHRFGVGDEGAVRGRPRHAMRCCDLGHRAGRLADRRADLANCGCS